MTANYVMKPIENDQKYTDSCVMAPMPQNSEISYSPFEPPYADVKHLFYNFFTPYVQPYEYTGWRDEQLSWEKSVYIHAGLSCSPYFRFQGPDALKFLQKHCTNSFAKYPVGSGKHVLTCNEKGQLTCHGMMFKVAEDCYDTYFMMSLAAYYQAEASEYDMQCIDLTGKKFLFQIGDRKSVV